MVARLYMSHQYCMCFISMCVFNRFSIIIVQFKYSHLKLFVCFLVSSKLALLSLIVSLVAACFRADNQNEASTLERVKAFLCPGLSSLRGHRLQESRHTPALFLCNRGWVWGQCPCLLQTSRGLVCAGFANQCRTGIWTIGANQTFIAILKPFL